MRAYILIYILLAFCPHTALAEDPVTDAGGIEQFPSVEGKARVDSLNALSARLLASDDEKARIVMYQALSLAQSLGYREGLAVAYCDIGQLFYDNYDYESARDRFKAGLDELDGDESHPIAGTLWARYGIALYHCGESDAATGAFHNSERVYTALADTAGLAFAYNMEGLFHFRMSYYDSALVHFDMARDFFMAVDDKRMTARLLNNLGATHYQLGDYNKALPMYLESLNLRHELDDRPGVAFVLNNIGKTYLDLGNKKDALRYFDMGLDVATEIKDDEVIGYSLYNIGEVQSQLGKHKEALEYFTRSEKHRRAVFTAIAVAQSLNAIAQTQIALSDYDSAMKAAGEAYELASSVNNLMGMSTALRNRSQVHAARKDYRRARRDLEESLRLSRETGSLELERETLATLMKMAEQNGKTREAFLLNRQVSAIKDSLFSDKTAMNIDRLRIEFESDVIEQQNSLLRRQQNSRERILASERRILILSSLLLVMIAAFGIIMVTIRRQIKKKRHALEMTNRTLTIQRDQIEAKNSELVVALDKINTLSGFLPICASCKKIRTDDGFWQNVEDYISDHSQAEFSESLCDDCLKKLAQGK